MFIHFKIRDIIKKLCDLLLIFISIFAMISLILLIFFDLSVKQYDLFFKINGAIAFLFIFQEIIRIPASVSTKEHFKERTFEIFISIIVIASFFLQDPLLSFINFNLSKIHYSKIITFYLSFLLASFLFSQMIRFLRGAKIVSKISLTPSQIFTISFLIPITIGAFLFKFSKATHIDISWVDAFFISFSAFCVTGLAPFDISTGFNNLGLTFLTLFVQVGALGIVTLSLTFGHIFNQKLGLQERLLMSELLSEEKMGEVTSLITRIITLTFIIESTGALFLYLSKTSLSHPFNLELFFSSIFYSIMAFCNAGFSLFPSGIREYIHDKNYFFTFTLMALIFLGSSGYPLLINLYEKMKDRTKLIKISNKMILYSHLGLLLFGFLALFATDFRNQISSNGLFDSFFNALFLSVSSRTGGFNLVPTESLSLYGMIFCLFLMWIGGSPNSTSGGIKNITFAIALLSIKTVIRGKNKVIAFERELPLQACIRAFTIIFSSILIIGAATLLVINFDPQLPAKDILFEVVSAFSTTGLSRGITSQLSDWSKITLMILMITGRVGIITILSSFCIPAKNKNIHYLKENINI